MRLSVPELVIGENDGFSPKNDIFKRKEFGTQLYNLVRQVDGASVFALDAPWGEGKTTFIKMWRGLLNENGLKSIYFDAFARDYHSDPFMAFTSEIYSLFDDGEKEKKERFKKAAGSVFKSVGRVGLNVGLKILTAGAVDGTCLDGLLDPDAVAGAADSLVDRYIEQQLAKSTTERHVLEEFRTHLSKLPSELGTEGPIVFIIDELDRCRPDFALNILEHVKHVFQVENFVFVLAMNRDQVEESVKVAYGRGVNATSYLQKFFTLWLRLPKRQERNVKDVDIYTRDCLEKMQFKPENDSHEIMLETWGALACFYNLSLREIEKGLTNFAIIHNSISGRPASSFAYLAVFISIVKMRYPSVYHSLVRQTIPFSEFAERTQLNLLPDVKTFNGMIKHNLYTFVKYCLSEESEAQKMKDEIGRLVEPKYFRDPKNDMMRICSYLDMVIDGRQGG